MAIRSLSLTVTTTATPLIAAHNNGTSDGMNVWCEVANNSGKTVYLGGADVTTSNGRAVADGQSWAFTLSTGDALYGVVASTTAAVIVIRGRA